MLINTIILWLIQGVQGLINLVGGIPSMPSPPNIWYQCLNFANVCYGGNLTVVVELLIAFLVLKLTVAGVMLIIDIVT